MGTALMCMAVAACCGIAAAQAPLPVLSYSFDETTGGWMAAGTDASVSVSSQTSWNGRGSLRFDYTVAKGKLSALTLQTPLRVLESAKSFRFRANANYATSLVLILQEKTGARYAAPFSLPKGVWQAVELSLADFTVMEGLGGPPDANGRLDMDQVISLAILDFGQMFTSMGDSEVSKRLAPAEGKRVVYFDDFTVLREPLRDRAAGDLTIDSFNRPQPQWIGIGSVSLSRIEGTPPALRVDYVQAPDRIAGLLRLVRPGSLAGATRLSMNLTSSQPATLLVQLEESGGGKFNTMVTVKALEEQEVAVDLASLNPADDSAVKDRSVDPAKIARLLILDAYGMMEMPLSLPNTLVIRNVRALAAH